MNIFEIGKAEFKVFSGRTAHNYRVDESTWLYDYLPEPDSVYQFCQRKGLTESQTIDFMLRTLHKQRLLFGDYLAGFDLCVAFIGGRGGGKSTGATALAIIDGLLAGKRVVSNMPVGLTVRYRDCSKIFQTEDIDAGAMLDVNSLDASNYFNCFILVDEINVFLADSLRSNARQAFLFSFVLQQMRHRRLSFVFSTQNEEWMTSRARFQTDIYISCRDACLLNGHKPKRDDIGRKSRWQIYDMSGIITGEPLKVDNRGFRVPPFKEITLNNVPFWGCFSTELIQQHRKIQPAGTAFAANTGEVDMERLQKLATEIRTPVNLALQAVHLGVERIAAADLWLSLRIDSADKILTSKVGKLLSELGCTRTRTYFTFPGRAVIEANLARMGLNLEVKNG